MRIVSHDKVLAAFGERPELGFTLNQLFLRSFSIGYIQKSRDKVIPLVPVSDTIIPTVIKLKMLLKTFRLPCPGHTGISPDPIERIVLNAGKSLCNFFPSRIYTRQFPIGVIRIEESIIHRFACIVIDHFMVCNPDGSLLEQGPKLPLRIQQRIFRLFLPRNTSQQKGYKQ